MKSREQTVRLCTDLWGSMSAKRTFFSLLSEKFFVEGMLLAAGDWSRVTAGELAAWRRPGNILSIPPEE